MISPRIRPPPPGPATLPRPRALSRAARPFPGAAARRAAASALAAGLLVVFPTIAPCSGPVLTRYPGAEELLARGMPLSAARALGSLPPASRGKWPLLPLLIRKLGEAGHDGAAVALFEEMKGVLPEPVRSEAALALGRLHWARGDFARAARAFGDASGTPGTAAEAALYTARLQAAEGNAAAAERTLAAAPPGRRKEAVAAKLARARGARPKEAAASPPAGTASALPARTAALADRAREALSSGAPEAALGAAREGVAAAAALRAAVSPLPAWDGTRAGAEERWSAMAGLFPDRADAGPFLAAGGRFLAAAALADTAVAARNGCREIGREATRAKGRLEAARVDLGGRIRRAGEIRALLLAGRGKALAVEGRLRTALDNLSLRAWGAATERGAAALLADLDRELGELRGRFDHVEAILDRRARMEWSPPLAPEDRLMVILTQARLARIGEQLPSLEGRAAFLRARVLNRWKASAAARASALLDRAARAAAAADSLASRASAAVGPLNGAREETTAWIASVDGIGMRVVRASGVLERNAELARNLARTAQEEAARRLEQAVGAEERSMRYLAARAATERLLSGGEVRRRLPPADRAALRTAARTYWEGAAPSSARGAVHADEALYALAEISFEEEEARLHGMTPAPEAADFRRPATLFRRLIAEHPESPYAESGRYGLALCLEKAGDSDGAVAALKDLLARFPSTRYASEAHLRLGEHAFLRSDHRDAESHYRKVGADAPPAVRAAARVKLGWTLFLSRRPKEALETFLDALAASEEAPGGVEAESLRMAARCLVEARLEREAVPLLERRGAGARGPALLAKIIEILDAQNRYGDVAAAADRFGAAYPLDPRRLDAEFAAASALRKEGRADDGFRRQARLLELFGPRSRWRNAPGRTPAEAARADAAAERGLREAGFHFHGRTREKPAGSRPPPGRGEVLALYDAYLAAFPAAPEAGEVAFHRAWLLYEDGRTAEAGGAFEAVAAGRPGGPREETARYMALQCAKDALPPSGGGGGGEDAASLGEVIRLCDAYERGFPEGPRIADVLLDRARALRRTGRHGEAARDAGRAAAARAASHGTRMAALQLEGESRFEAGDYGAAEAVFRTLLASAGPGERREAESWVAFSMFRRAEAIPPTEAARASRLFARVADEFPSHEIAPAARFRSGSSALQAGDLPAAFAAFLAAESGRDPSLSLEATRRLAALDEASGENARAAARYERLAAAEKSPAAKAGLHFRAAGLLSGRDEDRARRNDLAAAAVEGCPPDIKVAALFRAGESARGAGREEEADRHYQAATSAHRAAPLAAPESAAKAFFQRAQLRFARYARLRIAPPFEKSLEAKEAALAQCTDLYREAVRLGDAETSSAALHRIGEALEAFRDAILSAPPPRDLSKAEREEYALLLEEKAAPIAEKAVEAYAANLRRAVAAGFRSAGAEKSLGRLRNLRPALFAPKWEYALPVVTVPVFLGIVERSAP